MKTVHKHEMNLDNENTVLELPIGAKLLDVDYLVTTRSVYVWVEVKADFTAEKEERQFKVFKSGDGIPASYQYVGTAIDQYTPEAYHVYEVLS